MSGAGALRSTTGQPGPLAAISGGGPGGGAPGLVEDRLSRTDGPPGEARKAGLTGGVYKAVDACHGGWWHLLWGDRETPENWKPCPFFCGSWRHAGDCARHRSQLDYTRLMEALARYPLESVTWGVLTLNPADVEGESLATIYRGLEARWSHLAKTIRRRFGKFEYHASVEAHGSGMPHINLVIVSPAIAAELRERPATGKHAEDGLAPRWWIELTTQCGFGYRVTLEHVAAAEAVASYVTKMDKGAVMVPHVLGAEVVKTSQLPTMAPKRFRRIRSSKGFLPPIKKDPDISGKLVQTPLPEVMRAAQAEAEAQLAARVGLESASQVYAASAAAIEAQHRRNVRRRKMREHYSTRRRGRPPKAPPAAPVVPEEVRAFRAGEHIPLPEWMRPKAQAGPPPEVPPEEGAEVPLLSEEQRRRLTKRGRKWAGVLWSASPADLEQLAAGGLDVEGMKRLLHAGAYDRKGAARVAYKPPPLEVDDGGPEYHAPEPPRRDTGQHRGNRARFAIFEWQMRCLEAEARGEDPNKLPVPRWAFKLALH